MSQRSKHLIIDLVVVAISILLAVYIGGLGIAETVVSFFGDLNLLGIFISGVLFTSFFTTAPAIVLLGQFSESTSLWVLVLIGGIGSVLGDCLLFWFVRDRIAEDLNYLVTPGRIDRLTRFLHTKLLRRLTLFLGLLIIASPLPDEMGIALLGINKMKIGQFIIASFVANATGILIIGLVARALII